MTEAFPRRPAPRHGPPTPAQIRQAREDFALHGMRSLFTAQCLAPDCEEDWPCTSYRQAVPILERGNQFDVDGHLRPSPARPDVHRGRPATRFLTPRQDGASTTPEQRAGIEQPDEPAYRPQPAT